jgi:hypothetical protein
MHELGAFLNDRAGGAPFNRTSLEFRDGPAHATLTISSNGTVVWTPEPDYYGATATLSALAGPPEAIADDFSLVQGDKANLDLHRDRNFSTSRLRAGCPVRRRFGARRRSLFLSIGRRFAG